MSTTKKTINAIIEMANNKFFVFIAISNGLINNYYKLFAHVSKIVTNNCKVSTTFYILFQTNNKN
jgi:hypothetical protein